MAQLVKNPPAMQETWVRPLGWEKSPREGNGNPLQYSCLENSMDRGAWWATVHGVVELDTTDRLILSRDTFFSLLSRARVPDVAEGRQVLSDAEPGPRFSLDPHQASVPPYPLFPLLNKPGPSLLLHGS